MDRPQNINLNRTSFNFHAQAHDLRIPPLVSLMGMGLDGCWLFRWRFKQAAHALLLRLSEVIRLLLIPLG
eukprot:7195665-Pyramimonas_sp.AAC.1